jgi:nucleotide-binding universal stress UspA family protein
MIARSMSAIVIVSYDGTPNDDDALALGTLLAEAGARLALAYVRHAREFDPAREQLAQHDAERRLEHGAILLGAPQIPRHVVFSASTGEGLAALAERERASLIAFGSDYRTPPGRVEPGQTAQHLLEGGAIPVAVAPAGFRLQDRPSVSSIVLFAHDGDEAARRTAEALGERLAAEVLAAPDGDGGLYVVGSQPSAPEGRIALGGTTRMRLNEARGPVLVVPKGRPVLL